MPVNIVWDRIVLLIEVDRVITCVSEFEPTSVSHSVLYMIFMPVNIVWHRILLWIEWIVHVVAYKFIKIRWNRYQIPSNDVF